MINSTRNNHRSVLKDIARQAMLEQGFLPDYSPHVLAELESIQGPRMRLMVPSVIYAA